MLLNRKAEANVVRSDGLTPFHILLMQLIPSPQSEHILEVLRCLKILLNETSSLHLDFNSGFKAKWSPEIAQEMTPLQILCSYKSPEGSGLDLDESLALVVMSLLSQDRPVNTNAVGKKGGLKPGSCSLQRIPWSDESSLQRPED